MKTFIDNNTALGAKTNAPLGVVILNNFKSSFCGSSDRQYEEEKKLNLFIRLV